jgi:hypothetical protein
VANNSNYGIISKVDVFPSKGGKTTREENEYKVMNSPLVNQTQYAYLTLALYFPVAYIMGHIYHEL